jgi:hypothetical protein
MIDVTCPNCGSHYRVAARLAGRVAGCKKCARRFIIPLSARDEASTRDEPNLADLEATVRQQDASSSDIFSASGSSILSSDADTGGSLSGSFSPIPPSPRSPAAREAFGDPGTFAIKVEAKAEKQTTRDDIPRPIVAPIMADLWIPLTVALIGYGGSLYKGIDWAIDSKGPVAGCILITITVGMFLAAIFPLIIKMLHSAADSVEFALPNAVWMQAAGAFALPTLGLTLGWFDGGLQGLAAGGAIGFVFMVPLMSLMYRIGLAKGLQTALLSTLFYLLGLGFTAGVFAGVALLVLPMWRLSLPWQDPASQAPLAQDAPAGPASPERVSTARPMPSMATPPKAPMPAPAASNTPPASPKPVDRTGRGTPDIGDMASAAAERGRAGRGPMASTPTGAARPELFWRARPIAAPATPVWPARVYWDGNIATPVTAIYPRQGGSAAALVASEQLTVLDLRTGRQTAAVPDSFDPDSLVISPTGDLVAGVRYAAGALEVWSPATNRLLLTLETENRSSRRALGFTSDGKFLVANQARDSAQVQVWDPQSARAVRSFDANLSGTDFCLSPTGRYIASLQASYLEVCDTEDGKLVGRTAVGSAYRTVKAMAFSPSGLQVAAIVADLDPPWRVLIWDLATGELEREIALPGGARPGFTNSQFSWLPDGLALLVGGDLIDIASGRSYGPRLGNKVAGQSMGRPVRMLSNYSVLYEYLPSGGGQKVILRADPLPRSQIDPMLTELRGQPRNKPDEPSNAEKDSDRPNRLVIPPRPRAPAP